MNPTMQMLGIGLIIIFVNACAIAYYIDEHRQQEYLCISGLYKGQTHTIKDWRKIALDLAKTVKRSELNAHLKYGTDEDIIGLLYLNFGVELIEP